MYSPFAGLDAVRTCRVKINVECFKRCLLVSACTLQQHTGHQFGKHGSYTTCLGLTHLSVTVGQNLKFKIPLSIGLAFHVRSSRPMISARNADITLSSYFVHRPVLKDAVAIVQKSMILFFGSCKFTIDAKINHKSGM